jgi:hypothetical protein
MILDTLSLPKKDFLIKSQNVKKEICLSMNFTESLQQQLKIQVNKVCVMSFSDQKKFAWLAFAFARFALLCFALQNTRALPKPILHISS